MEDKNMEHKEHKEYKDYEDYDDLKSAIDRLEAAAEIPVEPDPQFKVSARKRILNAFPEAAPAQEQRKRAHVYSRRTGLRLVAVFTAVALALSGVAFASNDSLPGDTLYPVKRAVEQGRVVIARNDQARAGVYADLADRRLKEIEALVKAKRTTKIDATLQLMGTQYDYAQAAGNRLPPAERDRLLARLETAVARQQALLDSYSKDRNVPQAVIVRNLERIKRNREIIRDLRRQRFDQRGNRRLEPREQLLHFRP
jgi:hypothetical protein